MNDKAGNFSGTLRIPFLNDKCVCDLLFVQDFFSLSMDGMNMSESIS